MITDLIRVRSSRRSWRAGDTDLKDQKSPGRPDLVTSDPEGSEVGDRGDHSTPISKGQKLELSVTSGDTDLRGSESWRSVAPLVTLI